MTHAAVVLEEPLERALQSVVEQRGVVCGTAIRPILYANLERARICYFLENNASATVGDYVWRVVRYWDELSDYVYQVQVEKSAQVWEPLLKKLNAWAYTFLGRWELDEGERIQSASECADSAGGELVNARFPFDTEFDRWARVLLHNICRRHVKGLAKSGWVRYVVLSDWPELGIQLSDCADNNADQFESRMSRRYDLRRAIARLTEKRRQMIVLHYLEGKSFAEIANLTGVKPSTLHKRHFDALVQLRDTLGLEYTLKVDSRSSISKSLSPVSKSC